MNSYDQHLPVVVLIALACLGGYVMWRAQKRDGFDFSNMLRDENGKESAVRLGILVSLAISTWWVVWMALHNILGVYEQLLYLGTWAGVAAISKAIETWGPKK
jgi:hypothetical protein